MNNQELMRQAKAQISGNWLNAAIGTLVYTVILGAASFTYVGELILFGPLMFGFVLFVMNIVDNRRNDLNLLFSGFNRFAETLVAGLLYSLAVSVGTALLIVPGIIIACGFSMTFFLMADDRSLSGVDALQKSWNMMRGHKWDFFCLQFRFIGWLILCALTFGILTFWVTPYMTAASLGFYRQLRYTLPKA